MSYRATVGQKVFGFADLRELMGKASPARSGDQLAGVGAETAQERVAAQAALADVPLATFLSEAVVPYETDDVTRLIVDTHDAAAFATVRHLTVGGLRDWLLSDAATPTVLAALAPGLTPEMVAAASKIMRNQDLILVASRCQVVTRFRNTLGLPGSLAVRLQPNHPTDSAAGILASIVDGLMYGAGDAVIGINPATDSLRQLHANWLRLIDGLMRLRLRRSRSQSCVLAHVTNTPFPRSMAQGAPVDLVFQSIAGTEATNRSFGVSLSLLAEAYDAMALSLEARHRLDDNVMYFETGQGTRAVGQRASRRRPADPRGARLRGRPPIQRRCWSTPWWASSGRNICMTASRSSAPGLRIISAASCSACRWAATSATRTMPRRTQDDMDALLTLLAAAGLHLMSWASPAPTT